MDKQPVPFLVRARNGAASLGVLALIGWLIRIGEHWWALQGLKEIMDSISPYFSWEAVPYIAWIFSVSALVLTLIIDRHKKHRTLPWNDDFKLIHGRHYENEEVPLDAMHFRECQFKNVTFWYNGGGDIRLENCTMSGGFAVKSASKQVSVIVQWLLTIQSNPNLRMISGGTIDDLGRMKPIYIWTQIEAEIKTIEASPVIKDKIEVIEAIFGHLDTWINVSSKIQDQINNNSGVIRADVNSLGEPCHGKPKTLRIRYTKDGLERSISVPENETRDL